MRMAQTEVRDRLGAAGEEAPLEVWIGPRARNDFRSNLWADLLGVDLNPRIHRARVHHTLLDKQALECLHPQRWFGRQVAVKLSVDLLDLSTVVPGHGGTS